MSFLKRLVHKFSTEVAQSQQEVMELFKKHYSWKPKNIYSYYNSEFDRIYMAQHLMLIPIDERMITCSHAVFDTLYIKKRRIINMHRHIDRLFRSAKLIAIKPCFSEKQVEQKILDLTRATFEGYMKRHVSQELDKKVFALRLNFSAGHEEANRRGNSSIFYASIYESNIEYERDGVKDFVTCQVSDAVSEFTHSKTVNYADNAMMATESKRRGGYQGIKCTKDRVILEASVANVGFVFPGRLFVTPRLETVIKGTTLMEIIKHLQEEVRAGRWGGVVFRDITVEEAYTAQEMMIIGGDKIVPVLQLDGKAISPAKGPLASYLQQWYEENVEKGTLVQM